jgi:hypothetical protein
MRFRRVHEGWYINPASGVEIIRENGDWSVWNSDHTVRLETCHTLRDAKAYVRQIGSNETSNQCGCLLNPLGHTREEHDQLWPLDFGQAD